MTTGATQLTKRTTLVRSLSISAVTALMLIPALASATDPDKNADVAVTSSIAAKTRSVSLGVGKSVVVDLPNTGKVVLAIDAAPGLDALLSGFSARPTADSWAAVRSIQKLRHLYDLGYKFLFAHDVGHTPDKLAPEYYD